MQTLSEKNLSLFLKLISNATLTETAEIQIRGKISLVVELVVDIPNTPNGRLKKYTLSNYQTDSPFIPEIGFLLLDNQASGTTDHQNIQVLPEWVWDENTAGKEFSASLTADRNISINPELNRTHCSMAEVWLAALERDGFGQPEEFK
ncbi:hypothetical protein [Puia dinghuensis]|uniref:Uncharacterized protein n=1 Tax=Puia dinghuensis TaxID=1792502 RepID=A0A8J2UBL7_9BACT|nr:hypothetical protein [Puia dinghuensis]GGA92571.1 hypothetical protein GCM10011511_14930 [Puia dinghuensis]